MPKTEILSKSYTKLVKDLKKLLIEGLLKAKAAVENQKIETYWESGRLITEHILESQDRAAYGKRVFILLAKDLNTDKGLLYQMTQFYRTFPNLYTCINLEWSHYRALIGVEDRKKRGFFQKQAVKEGWSVEKLQDVIRVYKLQLKSLSEELPEQEEAPKLSFTRGSLYTYKLIKPESLFHRVGGTGLLVDCGFYFWRQIPIKGIQNPEEGQIVESIKTEQGYKLKSSSATKKHLYTYKAFVERVTDADTIWVNIDLGFASWTRQKLRFRGIDAPEISTKKGRQAKEFVEAALSKVPFIIIKSHSLDKYGRPLTDIFYLENENNPQVVLEKGIFLNQQLLDLGLAKEMKD
ncbi:MAG: thermonuclease family protein [Candidatus Omnitrophica bacterium]|nr:thermonuclease family protein [Candidatus Omnitrophota bacterium]